MYEFFTNFQIAEDLNMLLINKYGNYFCQKLFISLNEEKRIAFLSRLDIEIIGKSEIGTYPLQNIIENLKTSAEKQILITKLANLDLFNLSIDKNAVHIVDKLILFAYDFGSIKTICYKLLDFLLQLCFNPYGIGIVFQKFLYF